MLKKVISGGQTGVDRIGLIAARHHGLKTGGFAPKGYRTEKGSEPNVLKAFGLEESTSSEYKLRTQQNVLISDGTILFGDMESKGSKMTLHYLNKYHIPFICNPTNKDIINRFIKMNEIETLNIAGNRGSRMTEQAKIDLVYFLADAFEYVLLNQK